VGQVLVEELMFRFHLTAVSGRYPTPAKNKVYIYIYYIYKYIFTYTYLYIYIFVALSEDDVNPSFILVTQLKLIPSKNLIAEYGYIRVKQPKS